eukprot:1178968-Prorocentrum_minimum.AAC.1
MRRNIIHATSGASCRGQIALKIHVAALNVHSIALKIHVAAHNVHSIALKIHVAALNVHSIALKKATKPFTSRQQRDMTLSSTSITLDRADHGPPVPITSDGRQQARGKTICKQHRCEPQTRVAAMEVYAPREHLNTLF